jgi:hypothetical protein
MSYNFVADRIEVRSAKKGDSPRYIVKATALVPNKKDIYQYQKNKDGSIKSFKSMFTDKCIASIKEQASHKHMFVDSQHKLVMDSNIESIIKGKVSDEEMKKIKLFLKTKQLPIAKLNEIEITENGLDIETELNPLFREVDIEHQKYFDAIWYSLENKYLNGVSINFVPTEVTLDTNGDQVIDNVDIFGFSYVDQPALADNSIYEVAIRSMQEIETRSGVNMEDEKMKIEAEKAKIAEERAKIDAERAELEKARHDAEIRKQTDEQKRVVDELAKKNDELKAAQETAKRSEEELNRVKGQVAQQQPPTQPKGKSYDKTFYAENLKEITRKHDESIEILKRGQQPIIDNHMSGFAELINLQAKINDPLAGLDAADVAFAKEHRILSRDDSDILARQK